MNEEKPRRGIVGSNPLAKPLKGFGPSRPRKGDGNKFQLLVILRSLFGDVHEEYQFHPTRKWRFDFAIPSIKLAVEYNGHGSTGGGHIGRHASITGMSGDCEKLNQAQALGWTVIQFTALHFAEASRKKHKLTEPYDTLKKLTS